MWPEPVERVAAELRAAAVDSSVQEFPEGTPTAEAAARAVGCGADQIVKSIVFICDGEAVVALVPGDRRADEAKIAAALPATDVRIAYAREVLAATGFEPGSVAPFPLPAVSAVLLDRRLLQYEIVWVGAGSPSHLAAIGPTDLKELSGARIADIAVRGQDS